MPLPIAVALVALVAVAQAPDGGTGHDRNAVYAGVLAEGLEVGGRSFRLPPPTFADEQSADEQREALRALAGSARAAEGLLRDSVTAPFVLRLRDDRLEGATVRGGVLYFVLRVDLDAVDPDRLLGVPEGESEAVEAGNMRFEARVLSPDESGDSGGDRLVRATGRLLDRIAVESTSRVASSRSGDSVVVASRTDPRFDGHDRRPNRWQAIERRGGSEALGEPSPFPGGIGYAKVTRLQDTPGAAVVELHFAFAEPIAWFDGAPILRSKFGLVAQDQIRRVRRELAREAAGR